MSRKSATPFNRVLTDEKKEVLCWHKTPPGFNMSWPRNSCQLQILVVISLHNIIQQNEDYNIDRQQQQQGGLETPAS